MRRLNEGKAFEIVITELEKDKKALERKAADLQVKIDGLNYAIRILEECARVAEQEEVQLPVPGGRGAP